MNTDTDENRLLSAENECCCRSKQHILSGASSVFIRVYPWLKSVAPAVVFVLFFLFEWSGTNAEARSQVEVSVAADAPGKMIPEDFAGLSFETGSEMPNRNRVAGHLFSTTNTELIQLFQNAGIHNLRVGGGTVDGLKAATPDFDAISNLFGFVRSVGDLKVIYSLRLLNGDSVADAATAQFIWRNYRPALAAFSVGNEPDWKSYHYPPFGRGTDAAITNYASYLNAWRAFAVAITNAAPGATFAGPDTGDYTGSTDIDGKSWTQRFAEDEKSSGIVSMVTQHYYVGGNPGTTSGAQAISNLLSREWTTKEYPWFYDHYIAPVASNGLPYRLTEANDYLVGIANASDSYASALWALDFLHWWAARGCAGVNFHNKSWLLTDTVYLDAARHFQVTPKAYGIKAFELSGRGRAQSVTVRSAENLNFTAYAVNGASNLFITLINKEYGAGARTAEVTIQTKGISEGRVYAMTLAAANGNIAATNGVTLGGKAIANDQLWEGSWVSLLPLSEGRCSVSVGAASAVVLKVVSTAKEAGESEGLAAKYPGDVGIEHDSDVVFAENFEGKNLATIGQRWSELRNDKGTAMSLSKQTSKFSPGRQSLQITATRDQNFGGHLFKVLPQGYDELYVRFYVKFAADHGYLNHFVKLQGSVNPPPYPEGEAGHKHTNSFSTGLEPQSDYCLEYPYQPQPPPGIWHFYSYWPEMHSWQNPDGTGTSFYGNDFEPKQPVSVPRNQWQCVEFMVKMNSSPDKSDGEQAFWIDGQLRGHFAPGSVKGYWIRDIFRLDDEKGKPFSGFRWRTDPRININKLWLLYYVNPSEGTAQKNFNYRQKFPAANINLQTSTVWFDDLVVAKKYIGPIAR